MEMVLNGDVLAGGTILVLCLEVSTIGVNIGCTNAFELLDNKVGVALSLDLEIV